MYKQKNYEVIGSPMNGGMGQVHHLYHKHWKKHVAMKQPLEKYLKTEAGRKCFYEECRRWLQIGIHPHIVQCYYVCDMKNMSNQAETIPTVFMEWMKQGSLGASMRSGQFYKKNQKEVLESIIEVAIQMAEGLAYAHKKEVLHLDVKPDNVLIDEEGCYKVSDFGLASVLGHTSKIAYTRIYCAPEQQTGVGIDKRTDIYCWAVSVLHLLVREAKWYDGIIAGASFDEIVEQAVVKVPEGLKMLLKKCLEYEREKRPSSFEDVLKEIAPVYQKVFGKTYVNPFADYDGTSLDALNNMAISYYAIGDLENASKLWQWNYWANPEHIDSYYNYELFKHRFCGTCELNFLNSKKELFYTRLKMPAFSTMLKSEWQYSLGAYASAYKYAYQAKAESEKLFGPSNDIFAANFQFMKEAYSKIGPCVLKSLDLKKTLKIEGNIEEDCKLLAYIYDERILYLAKNGVYYLIDFSIPKIVRHQALLPEVSCATISKDGRYLAMGRNSENGFYKKYEVKVLDLKENKIILHKIGDELNHELQYFTFVEQEEKFPRLLAFDEWKIVSWKLGKVQSKGAIDDSFKYNQIMNKWSVPVSCVVETSSGSILAKSDRKIVEYDSLFLMECSEKLSLSFYELQKHKIVDIPNSNLVMFLDKSGGYIVYDYIKQYIVTQESFIFNGNENIHQISLNQKGDKMVVLCGDRLETRNMPDYKTLPEPLWKESSFKTTSEMVTKYLQVLEIKKILERALEQVIQKEGPFELILEKAMVVKLRTIRDYYYQSHKPIDEYLELASKMAMAFGFKNVKVLISRWTNEEMNCIKMDAKSPLKLQDGEELMNLDLISTESGKILRKNICYRNEVIGISDDYTKIICKNNTGSQYKYRVIPLEWVF